MTQAERKLRVKIYENSIQIQLMTKQRGRTVKIESANIPAAL